MTSREINLKTVESKAILQAFNTIGLDPEDGCSFTFSCRERLTDLCPSKTKKFPDCHTCSLAQKDHKTMSKFFSGHSLPVTSTELYKDLKVIETMGKRGDDKVIFTHNGEKNGQVSLLYTPGSQL